MIDGVDNAFQLLPAQKGMLYHCLESTESDVYVTYITLNINGSLDVARWKNAWQCVCMKHEALRSSFMWENLDEPLQLVHSEIQLNWKVSDIDALSIQDQTLAIDQYLRNQRSLGIEPTQKPPMHFCLFKRTEENWTFIWSIHHLLADGWSTPIILNDVAKFYENNVPANSVNASAGFGAYVQWQMQRENTEAKHWWLSTLKDAKSSTLTIPFTQEKNIEQDELLIPQCEYALSTEETQNILLFCQSQSITLSSLCHAAWAVTLANYTGADNVLFGTTVSGRHPEFPLNENIVGLLLSTLPVNVTIDLNETFSSFLKSLQNTLLRISHHDQIALPELLRQIDKSDSADVFESIVVIESHDNDIDFNNKNSSITLTDIDYLTHSHYPLALLVYPGQQIKIRLVYDNSRYTKAIAQSVLDAFLNTLAHCRNHSESSLKELLQCNWSMEKTQHKLHTPFNLSNSQAVHERIADIAIQNPTSIALATHDQAISYKELNDRANQFANYLQHSVNEQNTAIGIYLERSIDQIVALLGVLKSGHFYIPLDTSAPQSRTQGLLEQSKTKHIVCRARNSIAFDGCSVHDFEQSTEQPSTLQSDEPTNLDSLAYVMFTSGSSGQPKGVCVSHRNLAYSTAARLQYYSPTACNFLMLSSHTFDSSVAGLYWSLCTGGTLVLPKVDEEKDLSKISAYINKYKVSHTLCLPSLYALLLEFINPEDLLPLEVVVVAGEACPATLIDQHFAHSATRKLFNEYGPTEACVWSSVQPLTKQDSTKVSIGSPIPGTQVSVLNEAGNPCMPYAIGELHIHSPGVAQGYINNPIQTEQHFNITENNPFAHNSYKTGDMGYYDHNGLLYFTGRKDRQLKIRGHRIEPGEIEDSINTLQGIKNCVVLAHELPLRTVTTDELAKALEKLPAETARELVNSVRRSESIK